MDAISQTTFSNGFFLMKMYEFRLTFHWSLFLRFQLTIFQHWFRYWLGAVQATSHYLSQWWLDYRRIYVSLSLNELKNFLWQFKTMHKTRRSVASVGARIGTDDCTHCSAVSLLVACGVGSFDGGLGTGHYMMTSSNGNIFRVTGHLCGEFNGPRWIPHTKASDAELWCFLWSASE